MKLSQSLHSALLLSVSVIVATSAWPAPVLAASSHYAVNLAQRQLTVRPTEDDAATINEALAYLAKRSDKAHRWTLRFEGGQYRLNRVLVADRLENLTLEADPAHPAILSKTAPYPNEYLFYTRFSRDILVKGLEFHGSTPDYDEARYAPGQKAVWKDQGLYFGSCHKITVTENRFFNFSNAALRFTTANEDPVPGVNSSYITVTNNYFSNVFQVTTTSNDKIHGGSRHVLLEGNTFDNLRGSIKFATRTPGADYVKIRNNTVNGSSADGIEMVGYNHLEVINNTFKNITRNAINCYSNGLAAKGFQWGEHITFKNNRFENTGGGIRFSGDTYPDGFQPVPRKVLFENNTFTGIRWNVPAITLVNSPFNSVKLFNNHFSDVKSGKYIFVDKPATTYALKSNKANNRIIKVSRPGD